MSVGRQVRAGEEDAPGALRRQRRGTPRRAHARCARPGTRSGSMPAPRSASAVAGPTAATDTPARARASRSAAMKRVHGVDRCEDDPARCRAPSPPRRRARHPRPLRRPDGSGASTARWRPPAPTRPPGPRRVRPLASPRRCGRARGRPASSTGSRRPSAATGPTTMTAGGPRSTSASPASVVRATRWDDVVPRAITATGVSGALPALHERGRRWRPGSSCP